jgi:hypothetical protein
MPQLGMGKVPQRLPLDSFQCRHSTLAGRAQDTAHISLDSQA